MTKSMDTCKQIDILNNLNDRIKDPSKGFGTLANIAVQLSMPYIQGTPSVLNTQFNEMYGYINTADFENAGISFSKIMKSILNTSSPSTAASE